MDSLCLLMLPIKTEHMHWIQSNGHCILMNEQCKWASEKKYRYTYRADGFWSASEAAFTLSAAGRWCESTGEKDWWAAGGSGKHRSFRGYPPPPCLTQAHPHSGCPSSWCFMQLQAGCWWRGRYPVEKLQASISVSKRRRNSKKRAQVWWRLAQGRCCIPRAA